MKVFELPMVRVDDAKYTEGRTKVMTIKECAPPRSHPPWKLLKGI